MIFCNKQRILKTTEIPSVIINNMPIERVTCFTFLGVIIDSNLTWSHHINYISNTLTRICGVLSILKHYVPVLILKIIYNSLQCISISPKLWNNSMGFQCSPLDEVIPIRANTIGQSR